VKSMLPYTDTTADNSKEDMLLASRELDRDCSRYTIHLSLQGKTAVVDPGLEGHLFISMDLDFQSQLSTITASSGPRRYFTFY
jgi:hypothetical protein